MPGGNHSSNYHDLVNGLGQLILLGIPQVIIHLLRYHVTTGVIYLGDYLMKYAYCMYGSDNLGDYLMKYAYCMYGGVIPGSLPNEICILYVWGVIYLGDYLMKYAYCMYGGYLM